VTADDGSRPKVAYVVGTGRSGSTILGLALGSCEGVTCLGELHLWLGKAGRSPLRGERRERFWAQVRELAKVDPDLLGPATRVLERTAALFDPRTWRAQRRLRRPYLAATEQILRAAAHVAGGTHVVDTSHFPRRARHLQRLDGIELYLLFVVRDPGRTVASYRDDDRDFPQFNLLSTNLYVWVTYLLSVLVFLRHPRERRLLVSYEAFLEDPEEAVAEILRRIDCDAPVPDLTTLQTGVAFQGNPLLRSDAVTLKREPSPPPVALGPTRLLQAPWKAVFSRLEPALRQRP
jgi:Sulfotransferase family